MSFYYSFSNQVRILFLQNLTMQATMIIIIARASANTSMIPMFESTLAFSSSSLLLFITSLIGSVSQVNEINSPRAIDRSYLIENSVTAGIFTFHSVKNTTNQRMFIIPQRNFRDDFKKMLTIRLPEAAMLDAVSVAYNVVSTCSFVYLSI